MTKTIHYPQLTIKKKLDVAMYLTMLLSFIVISIFASVTMKNCVTVQIISKNRVQDKYFYTLSDGTQTWSDRNFAVFERVCVSNSTLSFAQK
jgi:hypothetical protein